MLVAVVELEQKSRTRPKIGIFGHTADCDTVIVWLYWFVA